MDRQANEEVLLKVRLATDLLISCLERHLYYCLPPTIVSYIFTATTVLLTTASNNTSSSSEPAGKHPAGSTRRHLQAQQAAIDGYVQRISFLSTSSAEPCLVTTKPKHVF